jgi:hypothetical protein
LSFSSSAPASNRKFLAIYSFLSQAKNTSATQAIDKPNETYQLIDSIASGVAYIDPNRGFYI